MKLIINKVIVIWLINSSIIYSLSSGYIRFSYYNTVVRIRTWVPNTDTPDYYGIKKLNKILKSLYYI